MRIMKIVKLLSALSMISSVAACTSGSGDTAVSVQGYDDLQPMEAIRGSVKDISLVQLETAPGCLLSSVSKLMLADSAIFVSDFDNLYSFDLSGRFLAKYGEKGNSENEYINLSTFMLDPEGHVVIADSYSGKLLYYSKDGAYIRCERLDTELLRYAQNGAFIDSTTIFFSDYLYNQSGIAYTTVGLKDREPLGEVRFPVSTGNTMVPLGRHPFSMPAGGTDVRYILPFSTAIYSLAGATAYDILTSQNTLSESDLSGITDFSIMTYANAMEKGDFLGFTDIFESERSVILLCWNIDLTIIDKTAMTCVHSHPESSDLPFVGLRSVRDGLFASAVMPCEIMPDTWDKFRTDYNISANPEIDADKNPIVIFYTLKE